MIFIIEQSNEITEEYIAVLALGNALGFYSHTVMMWDSSNKNMRDAIDEIHPSWIFYNKYVVSEKLSKFCEEHQVKLTAVEAFKGHPVCDPLFYNRKKPQQIFETDCVCIVEWEDTYNPELNQKLAIRGGKFRAYSPKGLAGPKYCGQLSRELHPLALSSAKSVLALSETAALNAALCNDKVIYKSSSYNVSKSELIEKSNLRLALQYVDNKDESRKKFDEFIAGI